MKYLYTIIIPTHNRSSLLDKNLQKLKDIKKGEVIIIENNSTEDELKKYALIKLSKNQRIFNIKDSDFRLSSARNFGVAKAKGNFIFFLDDDDEITSEFIKFLETQDLSKNVYRFEYSRDDGFKAKIKFGNIVRKTTKLDEVQMSSYLIKRDFFVNNNLSFKEFFMEDNIFAADLWKTGEKQYIIRGIDSIKYTTTNVSMTRIESGKTYNFEKIIKTLDFLSLSEYSDVPEYCFKVFNEAVKIDSKICSKVNRKAISEFWRKSKIKKTSTLFKLPAYYKFIWLKYKLTLVI